MYAKVLIRAFVLVLTQVGLAYGQDNLVANGGFDQFVPSNGTGGFWTTVNIDANGGWRGTGGVPAAHFIINDAGQPNTDPAISQQVGELIIGATYEIQLDYALYIPPSQGTPVDAFAVKVGPFLWELDLDTTEWQSFAHRFIATSEAMTIRLSAERRGSDFAARVDNISVFAVKDADLDGNGCVDLTDLAIVLGNFGCSVGSCDGDADADSDTDLSDLAEVLANFGRGC